MYSRDQIQRIRSLINDHFERGDVYDRLKQRIESSGLTLDNLDNPTLTKILEDTNLIDNLLVDIKHLDDIASYNQRSKKVLNSKNTIKALVDFDKVNYRSVSLRIYRGRAFLDFMNESPSSERFLQMFLSFNGQRFQSQQVKAEVEPDFNEIFIFDLQTDGGKANVDLLSLSKMEQPIEVSMILIDNKTQTRVLYSQKQVEWRFLLCYGNINLNIEMPLTHEQRQKMLVSENPYTPKSLGLLQVHLDLLPKSGLSLLPEHVLTAQIQKDRVFMQSSSDRFHTYSSAWWNDYKELKLPVRPVKLYAESQDGVWRPSSSFVTELVAVRGILTPNHAARFVSLIPFKRSERGPESNPERAEIWHKFTTFLSIRNGDFEDHCLLLCSLLLGFHLEAYVVIGASTDGAHGWVMTRQAKSLKPMAKRQVPEYTYHFWESLTGHKFELGDPRIQQMYKKIGCIFNHKCFFANIQSAESMNTTDLNIDDYTKWKAVDPQELVNIRSQNAQIKLLPSTLQPDDIESQIEHQLKSALSNYRKVLNLLTRFDEKLNGIVQIALANYSNERLTGSTYCQPEFQTAIKTYIPEGHVFKAFPISFTHMNIEKMLEAIKQAPVGAEIVTARGDQVHFALKVLLETYPEDIYALWVVVAVRYHHAVVIQ